jgi:hypothetical protein
MVPSMHITPPCLARPAQQPSYRGSPLLYTLTPVVASLSDVAYWFAPLLVHALQSTTAALDPMVF